MNKIIEKLKKLPRFDLEYDDSKLYYSEKEMVENKWGDGDWVKWEDIAKLIEEN